MRRQTPQGQSQGRESPCPLCGRTEPVHTLIGYGSSDCGHLLRSTLPEMEFASASALCLFKMSSELTSTPMATSWHSSKGYHPGLGDFHLCSPPRIQDNLFPNRNRKMLLKDKSFAMASYHRGQNPSSQLWSTRLKTAQPLLVSHWSTEPRCWCGSSHVSP